MAERTGVDADEPVARRAFLRAGGIVTAATALAAGPDLMSAPAHATEIGPWEYVPPGSSIQSAINGGAKAIQLGAGDYDTVTPISVPRGVVLRGVGQSTRIKCIATTEISEVIGVSGPADGIYFGDFLVQANSKARVGIRLNINGIDGNYWGEPDAVTRLDNLRVWAPVQDGISYEGSDTQSTISSRVRVRRAGRYAFNVDAPDNTFVACEGTTVDGAIAGFNVASSNNTFSQCGAWSCNGYGWQVSGVRNLFIGCQSSDTESHGWYITGDRNSYTGCLANSAGFAAKGGKPNTADGFFLAGDLDTTVMTGCLSGEYHRKQSQRYGFNIPKVLKSSGMFAANAGWGNLRGTVNLRRASILWG